MGVNTRGTFICSKYAIPYLRKSKNPHILTIAPPLSEIQNKHNWFSGQNGYTMSKFAMTMLTHGLAGELKEDGIGCNTLWPRTMVASSAVKNLLGGEDSIKRSRLPEILGEAAHVILTSDSKVTSDNCFVDDEVIASVYGPDLSKYKISPDIKEIDLFADFLRRSPQLCLPLLQLPITSYLYANTHIPVAYTIQPIRHIMQDGQLLKIDYSQSAYEGQQSGGAAGGYTQAQSYGYQNHPANSQHAPANAKEYTYMQAFKPVQSQQQEEEKKGGPPTPLFFENASKYLSLKKYNQEHNTFPPNTRQYLKNNQLSKASIQEPIVFAGPIKEKNLGIQDWFTRLSLQEKSIVLTVIDKQLVQLVLDMYKQQIHYGKGKYSNCMYEQTTRKPNNILKLNPYNLIFEQQRGSYIGQYLKSIQEAEDMLISKVRLLNLNHRDQQNLDREKMSEVVKNGSRKAIKEVKASKMSQHYDAITLDLDFYSNLTYFYQMMHLVNHKSMEFIGKEMKQAVDILSIRLTSDLGRLDQSVFYDQYEGDLTTMSQSSHEKEKVQSNKKSKLNQANQEHTGPFLRQKPRQYYTFMHGDGKSLPFSHQQMTLAQCLLLIFEKAINVQYYDYMNKFTNSQQNFFFTEPTFLIFEYDQRLAHSWLKMSTPERNRIIKCIDDIEDQLNQEEHMLKYKFSDIKEENEDFSSGDDSIQNNKKSSFSRSYKHKKSKQSLFDDDSNDNDDYCSDDDYDIDLEKQDFKHNRISNNSFSSVQLENSNNSTRKQHPKDMLMTQNKFLQEKSKILNSSNKANTQYLAFLFVKTFSTCNTLDNFQRKYFQIELRERLYLRLLEEDQKRQYEDLESLISESNDNSKHGIQAQNNVKSEKSEAIVQTQPSTTKKNKKKKNKNKSKTITIEAQTESLPLPLLSPNQTLFQKTSTFKDEDEDDEDEYNYSQDKDYTIIKDALRQKEFEQQNLQIVKNMMKMDQQNELLRYLNGSPNSQLKQQKLDQERMIEERTSLLTGQYIKGKYNEDSFNQGYSPPSLPIVDPIENTNDPTAQQKKKKRKKNKKKSKKTETPIKVEALFADIPLDKIAQDSMQDNKTIQNDQSDESSAITLESILILVNDNIQEHEQLLIAQITQETVPLNEDQQMHEVIREKLKFNNFLIEPEVQEDQKVQVLNLQIDEQEETKSFTNEITADIIEKILYDVESNDKITQRSNAKKQNSQNATQSQSKKKQKKAQRQKQLQAQNSLLLNEDKHESPLVAQYIGQQIKLEVYPPTPEAANRMNKKQVEFKIPRDESEDEDIQIPKRGSSRGSSVGTEDVIHMNTISSLGELFPSDYKNPSVDTKTKINEIAKLTTSTSNSPRSELRSSAKSKNAPLNQASMQDTMSNQNKNAKATNAPKKEPQNSEDQRKIDSKVSKQSPLSKANKKILKAKKQQQQMTLKEFDSYDSMFKSAYYGSTIQRDNSSSIQDNCKSPTENEISKEEPIEQKEEVKDDSTIKEPVGQPLAPTKKQHEQEKRYLKENGISVNPNQLELASNPTQLNTKINQNTAKPHQGLIASNTNNKRVKNKIIKHQPPYQQPSLQSKQQPLTTSIPELRSQTPIDQQGEPLSYNTHSHSQANKNHQHRKTGQNTQKGKNNTQSRKKPSNNAQNAQPNMAQQQYGQDGSQYYSQQSINAGAFTPVGFVPAHISQQQFMMPMQHPHLIFNQQNQSQNQHQPNFPFPPNAGNAQIHGENQSPILNPFFNQQMMYPNPFQYQQFLNPKITQETQTELSIEDMNKQQQDFIQQDQHAQQLNIQNMMYQIQNFNIQVYQMPQFNSTSPIMQNFNQLAFPNMIDPNLMQQWQLQQNQGFNPMMYQPQVPIPNPMSSNMNQVFQSQQQQEFQKQQLQNQSINQGYNQPFTNFQMAQNLQQVQQFSQRHDSKHVSHQTLESYRSQNREELFFQKFDREIYKLMIKQQMKLSETESERNIAFKYIEQHVKEAYQEFSNLRVQMYGSMATGLAIDSSDMDVLVTGVFNQNGFIDRQYLIDQMKRLHHHLSSLFCLESNSIIESASVPVIKIVIDLQKIRDYQSSGSDAKQITEEMKHLKIDITFNDQESFEHDHDSMNQYSTAQPIHMGIKCCHFIKEKLYEYPQLMSLTYLLKKFLALRDLNAPFMGGLSSYGLILLIIAFINQDQQQMYDPSTDQLSPARIFTQFLVFYGRIFDIKLQIINEYQYIVPQLNFSSVLIIIDPLNVNNNIGKSTYNFDKIKQVFAAAHDKISDSFNIFINGTEEDVPFSKLSILSKILYEESSSKSEEDADKTRLSKMEQQESTAAKE